MAAARPTSMRASFIGLPASRAMSAASSSSRPSMMVAASIRTAPREAGSVALHPGSAAAAASMALSVSALSDLGVVPRISEGLEGFTTSEVSPESAGTHSPPIKLKASVWASITVSSKSASETLSPFLYPIGARLISSRTPLSRHAVLQHEPAHGDLDPVPGRQGEVFVRHDAGPRHQEGPGGQRELPAQVLRELLEGAPHARGGDLALEDGRALPEDAQPDGQGPHPVRTAEHDAGTQGARAVVDLGLRQVERVLAFYVPR